MTRVVLFASAAAVLEMATCVGFHAGSLGATAVGPAIAEAHAVPAPASGPPVTLAKAAVAPNRATFTDRVTSEWDRLSSIDGAACRQRLVEQHVQFRNLPDQTAPDEHGCGIPHGVVVQRAPSGITYAPPLQIDCSLALELPAIERAIQDQAAAHLASAIRNVTTFGTYSCRKVRGGWTGKLSEHAFGNAIDFGAFAPTKGRLVSVARDYRPEQDAPDDRGLFLRGIFRALRQDAGLTYVIGPETRADHHDHIHVDRAEPWWQARPSGA
jgi:hypothetical protein